MSAPTLQCGQDLEFRLLKYSVASHHSVAMPCADDRMTKHRSAWGATGQCHPTWLYMNRP